ncbi:MAG: hypothetical protein JSW50_00285, partial [Candidatus Latescibacterota bacterium]
VPFFAILASLIVNKKLLIIIIGLLLVFDLVAAIDPISATGSVYVLANDKTLLQTLFGGAK